jgi:hypothetical protein
MKFPVLTKALRPLSAIFNLRTQNKPIRVTIKMAILFILRKKLSLNAVKNITEDISTVVNTAIFPTPA